MFKFFTWFPNRIEEYVRKLDAFIGGTETVGPFNRRSILAYFLPLPLYIFLIWGPSMAWDDNGVLVWRGGLTVFLLLVGVVILQTAYFFRKRRKGRHRMALLHLVTVFTLVLTTFIIAGAGSTQASSNLYRHYYGPLAIIAMFVAVPVAGYLPKNRHFALPQMVIREFQNNFDANLVTAQSSPKAIDTWDVLGAFVMAVLRMPLHVITPVAFVVLFSSPEGFKLWAILAAPIFLTLTAMSVYDPERDAFTRLVRHSLLSGGSLLVTLVVVVLAVLRLSGYDYVTTILDAGPNMIVFSYLFSTYALFWLYDFWLDQAVLDLLGDLGDWKTMSGELLRHGSGRIMVVAKGAENQRRMFEPVAFLNRIAQTARNQNIREYLQKEAARAEQRFGAFKYSCLALLVLMLCVIGELLHLQDQAAGLKASSVTEQLKNSVPFDLSDNLRSPDSAPVLLLAASGGGTRAALYTTAVLHGLARLGKLDRVVLVSGVSGGSAALAYYAINRKSLLENDDEAWHKMRKTLSAPFIEDVLAGAAEWRIASGHRLGQLLTESFEHRFLKDDLSGKLKERTNLGAITDVGLIFNTSLCGSPSPTDSSRHKVSAESEGGRLVITNLRSHFDMKRESAKSGWELDLPFKVVSDPTVSLFAAASLSANFPPLFSNAAVDLDGKRFWVTDGGAVENRGVISLLLALAESLEEIYDKAKGSAKRTKLADVRIIIADASAFQPYYKSDRGMGAKLGASEQLSNRLIKELLDRSGKLHESISGKKNGIKVVYLAMPESMRAAGTFGTHWMMPSTVTFKDPGSGDGRKRGIKLKKEDAMEIIDALFSKEYSPDYIRRNWPKLDADLIIKETKTPWVALETGLK